MQCLSIAAGFVLPAGAGVAPADVLPPAVWMDGPEDAARSDGWPAAVPAGAVAVVTAAARAGRSDATQVVVVALLRDAVAASRAAQRDVADALPAATDERMDVPDELPDDPAGQRDARDARRDVRGVRRGDPAVCREDRDGQAERPAGRAARLYRDGRDPGQADQAVGREDARQGDACQAGPDERRGDDPGHPGAKRREAA